MPNALTPTMAVRAALIAVSTGMTWHTRVAPAGTVAPFAVWTSATDDVDAAVFRRRGATTSDEFALYADATTTRTAQEVVYALYASLKIALDAAPLAVGTDATGQSVSAVRVRLTMVALLDEPDMPQRAHLACRLDTTVWSA